MKEITFTKMQGAGNDFIVIDKAPVKLKEFANRICDRKRGIGADGVLILGKSKKADYKMRIINADGSEAEMCGNGARCMAAYIAKTKTPGKKWFSIETIAGIILARIEKNSISVRLSNPKDYRANIPVLIGGRKLDVDYIDTGVPHAIIFVDGLKNIDVSKIGRAIRYHKRFSPRGTNADFVEQIGKDLIALRTYERGVEHETLACGTGSVASAIIAYLKSHPTISDKAQAKIKVQTASKEVLQITFSIKGKSITDVWLKGSATFIAQGEYYV